MKSANLIGIILVAFLAGGFLTFLGAIIRFFNAGDMLNFFDDKKHDKYKTLKSSSIQRKGYDINELLLWNFDCRVNFFLL